MFGSWVLEVAIGLSFVFLLFSTICAALREGIEAITKTRAAYLERGVRELLHDKAGAGLARKFYEHPLIYSLYAGDYKPGAAGSGEPRTFSFGRGLPSYIPARNFAAAMIDLAARGPLPSPGADGQAPDPGLAAAPVTAQTLRAGIAAMDNQRVARALLNALDLAQDDLNRTRLNLEAWFDAGMDRVSGWYKRSTQWIVFWLALAMAAALNVDAIAIANFLYRNDNARHAVVAQAEAAVAEVRAAQAGAQAVQARQALAGLRQAGAAPQAVDQAQARAAGAERASLDAAAQARVARLRAAAAGGAAAPEEAAARPGAVPGLGPALAKMELDALNLPIGWPAGFQPQPGEDWPRSVLRGALIVAGWLLTALAATLGAPFWFDILNKVMVIRSTVKPYEKSGPEGSEDRLDPDPAPPAPAGRVPR